MSEGREIDPGCFTILLIVICLWGVMSGLGKIADAIRDLKPQQQVTE